MRLTSELHDDVLAVTLLEDRLDYNNVNGFKNAMTDFVLRGRKRIVLNLGNIGFLDSRGLSALLSLHRSLAGGGRLVLCNVPPPVGKVFSMTRTDRIVPLCPDLQQAIAVCRS